MPIIGNLFHWIKWLESDFLKYMEDWRLSVMERKQFTKTQKNQMLLSHETQYGFKMTSKYIY